MSGRKEWMLGIPGHNELVKLDDVALLVRGGQLRPTDLVKKLGEPWRAANEIPELGPYFAEAKAPRAPEVLTAPPPEPPRRSTERVPKASSTKPPDSTRSVPRADKPTTARAVSAPPAPPREERRSDSRPASGTGSVPKAAPEKPKPDPRTETKADPRTETKGDPKAETKADPKSESKAPPAKPDRPKTRNLPRPPKPAARRLEPMIGKYYSPVDLLRSASFAFEPKKLLLSATTVPLGVIWSIGMFRSAESQGVLEGILFLVSMTILVFGLALILTGLAYVTRRQLEGKEYTVSEVVQYTVGNLGTALVYPLLVLLPSILSLGVLWILGLARNHSPGMATALKIGYLLPMIFALLAVMGAFLYQIASMYVPAAGAIEGLGLAGAVNQAWLNVRRQFGRVVLHWLIVTVAFGVITAVCIGLAELAIRLPGIIFGKPEDGVIRNAWENFAGLYSGYRGLAYGLGLMLPVSLFSTLGTLSYMALRHPAGAQVSPYPMDDTSGIAIPPQRGGVTPMEATNPAETRPAPPDATRPGHTPVADISDDSDEQPLVRE